MQTGQIRITHFWNISENINITDDERTNPNVTNSSRFWWKITLWKDADDFDHSGVCFQQNHFFFFFSNVTLVFLAGACLALGDNGWFLSTSLVLVSHLGDGVPVKPRSEKRGERAQDCSTNDISCVSIVGWTNKERPVWRWHWRRFERSWLFLKQVHQTFNF